MTRFLTLDQALKCIAMDVRYHVDAYLHGHPQRDFDSYRANAVEYAVRGLKAPEYCLMTGAKLKNLSKHLSAELKVPVSVLDPFTFLKPAPDIPADLAPAFAVAIGLALRRNKDWV